MFVWDAIGNARVPGYAFHNEAKTKELWLLHDSDDLPWYERNCLLSTYDKVIVGAEGFPLLAMSFDALVAKYSAGDRVCSLPAQAEAIRNLPADVLGVCWNQTSVTEPFWWIESRCPTCGEFDDGEGRTYNVDQDEGHWFATLTPSAGETDG